MTVAAAQAEAVPPREDEELANRRFIAAVRQTASVRWQVALVTLVVAVLAWPHAPKLVVAIWVALVLTVRELRVWALRQLVSRAEIPAKLKINRAILWNAAFGLAIGSSALFQLWLDRNYDAILTMILVSWAAGGVSTNAPLLRAYVVFAFGILVPTALVWLLEMTLLGAALCALIMGLFLVQYLFAKQNAAIFDESFRMRRENELLVQQLAAKQQDLTNALSMAEQANQAKTRFLAAASHDIRQPLHALALHSSLLAHDPKSPEAPVIAQDIAGSIDSLTGLLDSLLDISKLDAGIMTVESRPIRLDRLIANLARGLQAETQSKGIGLRYECPEVVINTDPMLLERVLRNLLDNAIKYTDQGEVSITVTGNETLLVSIRDTGRGIPESAQEKVFEEFYQLENPERDRKRGLGLGLAIVRRLGSLLGLKIQLSSRVGVGTTISFTMRRTIELHDEPLDHPVSDDALKGLNVLHLDDEEAVRRAMRATLQRMGCNAMEAATTEEALALCEATPPDIILADYRLRDGDNGIEAISRLRRGRSDLPALLISGDTDPQRLLEAEQSGLVMLHKPLTMDKLRIAISAALESATDTA